MHYDFCFIEIFRHINLDKESHDVENIEIWEKKEIKPQTSYNYSNENPNGLSVQAKFIK